jgi:hypothetical protein
LKDGKIRRATQKADAQGRLTFDLDGDAYEVGISSAGNLAVTGFELADTAWPTAGRPVNLRVRFRNKGASRTATTAIHWTSPVAGVKFNPIESRLYALGPGESADLPVTIEGSGAERSLLPVDAVVGADHLRFHVRLFPAAETATDFHIADGQAIDLFQHAVERSALTLGEGNGDGHAAPGESVVLLMPADQGRRAAELFTSDSCLDTSARLSDPWNGYDHVGASAKYTVATVSQTCQPGHVIHALGRVWTPSGAYRYFQLEFPVWYRNQ